MSFIMEVLSDVASKPQQVAPNSDDSDSEDEINRVRGQYKKRKKVDPAAQYNLKSHWAVCVKIKHFHGEGKLIRGGCRVCKQKVSSKCKKCDAYLCLDKDGDMSCFEEFHTR